MPVLAEAKVEKGLLVYDGDCGFCERTASWLRRRLPDGYAVRPSQKLDLDQLGLSRREVHEAAYWIEPDGTLHRGHRAVIRAFEAVGGTIGPLARLTKAWPIDSVASWVYGVIARNR